MGLCAFKRRATPLVLRKAWSVLVLLKTLNQLFLTDIEPWVSNRQNGLEEDVDNGRSAASHPR